MQTTKTIGGRLDRIKSWFPEREFFMRSEGQVRFITISSKLQMGAAAAVLALLTGWGTSLGVMAWSQYQTEADARSLMLRETRVATAEERVDAYREDIDAVAQDLEARQDFIETMWETVPADLKAAANVSEAGAATSQTANTVSKVSASFPEASALVEIEARQLAFVTGLTKVADLRSDRAAQAIRRLGLNPDSMLKNQQAAMGGPFEKAATPKGLDPRFEQLGFSLARLDALERVLDGIPQVMPASMKNITSGFGYRRDPFNRRGAMHRGIDFRGTIGTPIRAAANGRVSFVGWKGGYGKVVEIRHGNGLMTRYAHMSKFDIKRGERVRAGETIGAIGNTGRSTGPHLHFEVHHNNRAINPRPFLETAPDVLKEARLPSNRLAG